MDALSKGQLKLLCYLQKQGDCPRTELAKALGLTKASITVLTAELISSGLLVEKGEILPEAQAQAQQQQQPQPQPQGKPDFPKSKDSKEGLEALVAKKRGRRKVLIGINPNYRLAVGIAILEDGIEAGLTNLRGETLERAWFPRNRAEPEADQRQRELPGLIVKALEHLMRENCITSSRLLGVGICMTATANAAPAVSSGITPLNTEERLLRLKKELSHAVDIPIEVSTLTCGGLLARRLFLGSGNELNKDNSAALIASGRLSGVCLFANGRPYRGANGQAGGFFLLNEALLNAAADNNASAVDLAEELFPLAAFFDPSKIYGLGEAFEDEAFLKTLNSELAKLFPKTKRSFSYSVMPLGISRDKLFLCGAATAVDRLLFSPGR